LKHKGAGKTGCALHPRSRVQCASSKSAHEHTGSAETLRPSPRNGFTAYIALSPVTGFLATVATRALPRNLTPASGRQDHTILPYASARSSRTLSRPSQPGPTFMTTAKRPSCGPGWRKLVALICPTSIEEFFLERG
jgi:hypothetical protein